MTRVAINGLGRIGRSLLKVLADTPQLELVAINDPAPPENLAYLLKYDSVFGRYDKNVTAGRDSITVDNKTYKVFNKIDPAGLPWGSLKVDTVFECTGHFGRKPDLQKHITAGAKTVILSANPEDNETPIVVYGCNDPEKGASIISCGSGTTNCVAPLFEIMTRRIGIKKGMLTAIHSFTAHQHTTDIPSPTPNFRDGRSFASNLVPTTTGAPFATLMMQPSFHNKFDGLAVRVPISDGSLADITFITSKNTKITEVNNIFNEEANTARYRDVIKVTNDPLVSSDVLGDPHAAILDSTLTAVVDGDLVKIMAWYDNEWGYANQLVREGLQLARQKG